MMAGATGQKAQQLGVIVRRHGFKVMIVVTMVITFVAGFTFRGGGSVAPDHQGGLHATAQPAAQQYTCSMHPEIRMPNPDDLCPICNMGLVPVQSTSMAAGLKANEIELSPEAVALIDVETTPVSRRHLTRRVRMVGKVTYDETRLAQITAYVAGRLDRMYVDYTGIPVRKDDHLAEIYSPMLLVAQQELVEARRSLDRLGDGSSDIAREVAEAVLDSSRERLRVLGMRADQIAAAETGGGAGDHITLYAPIGGVVIEKHAKPGSYVNEGDLIYTIADLSQVWIILEAYESDLPWLRYGQDVEFTVQAFGDERFVGQVVFIDPILDPSKRTVRVRVNVDNTDGRLRPGMFVRADVASELAGVGRVITKELAGKWICPMHPEVIKDDHSDCPICEMDLIRAEGLGHKAVPVDSLPPLVVPDSAVLRTGMRGVVYVQTQEGAATRYEGRVVELGPGGDGFVIVRSGLEEGQLVVTRGNFQIDSALQIQAKQSMMSQGVGSAESDIPTDPVKRLDPIHGPEAESVRQLFTAYYGLSDALAMDDAEAAKSRAQDVVKAIESLDHAELYEAIARGLAEADGIEQLRSAFEPLSNEMISLLETTHIEGLGGVYRAYCPMAFDFTGASWLTTEKQIANPYFGASMLRCGTIEQTLSTPITSPSETDPSVEQHRGHNHE